MANRRKLPAAQRTPSESEEPRGRRSRSEVDLSDLDAPTNAFPIGAARRAPPPRGKSPKGTLKDRTGVIEWHEDHNDLRSDLHDDSNDNPVNNDIDDLSEDEIYEDPQTRQITVPAWMLLAWFTGASLLFGLAVVALVAAILFT
jgi:hypothetical protein